MLETLTVESFADRKGDTYRLELEESGSVALELVAIDANEKADAKDRVPFSLVFRGPKDLFLPQQVYQLESDAQGSIELFLVPIAPDEQGSRFEAVFT